MTINQFIYSIIISTVGLLSITFSVQGQELPNPADLISFENPQELSISPDGSKVIVRTKRANIKNNSYKQTIWLLSTDNKTKAKKEDLASDASSIQWVPKNNKIAYLSRAERRKQIWTKDLSADSVQQLTKERGGIKKFSISPDGKRIAYTTVDIRAMARARKQSKTNSQPEKGKEIDLLTFSAHQLTNNRLSIPTRPRIQLRIMDLKTGSVHKVTDSVSVRQLKWSPSGNKIAFSALNTSAQSKGIPKRASSLFVYDITSNESKAIKKGSQGEKKIFDNVITYGNPFWSPSGNKLGYLRKDYSDRWSSVAEIEVYDLQKKTSESFISEEEQEFYNPNFFWLKDGSIFVEFTNKAKHGLFRISTKDKSIAPVIVSNKTNTNFSFSSDNNILAWTSSSVGQFPEVFSSDHPFNSKRQISDLNSGADTLWLPKAKPVEWTSKDETSIQGWYIAPKNKSKNIPLITLLHGGPGIPVTNSIHPYMQQWPYPIQTLTVKGYAIFIPNYRGSSSFGKSFKEPTKPDQEPVDDVITGINYLVNKNLAHKDKLGIMGHSHGGWLGPMVAAEKPIFKAASFAEGAGNYLSLYGHQAGYMARELYEYHLGSSPYENTDRYLELSPAFKNSLTTQIPTLLEFGQQSPMATQGVEFAKAFWRHDTPHKLTIYPNERHNIRSPKMQIDAMERNIEWFEKWLPTDK